MTKKQIAIGILLLILGCLADNLFAQKVTKDADGNYVSVSTKRETKAKDTGKVFIDKQGKRYPVYVSENGKLFCMRVSKKTNKEYRYYLTEQK